MSPRFEDRLLQKNKVEKSQGQHLMLATAFVCENMHMPTHTWAHMHPHKDEMGLLKMLNKYVDCSCGHPPEKEKKNIMRQEGE